MVVNRSHRTQSNPEPVTYGRFNAPSGDLMTDSADLQEACEKGLEFALSAVGRPAGILFVARPSDSSPIAFAQKGLSPYWVRQLDDQTSPLHMLTRECILSGSLITNRTLPGVAGELDLWAAAHPIPAGTYTQGVLLIQGEPLSSEKLSLLSELAPVLGLSIQVFSAAEDHKRRLNESSTLQAELAELASNADLDILQRRLILGTNQIMQSETSILVLIDEDNPSWLVYKSLDCESRFSLHLQPDENKGPVSDCIKSGEVICLEGAQAQINFDPTCSSDRLLQVRSLICAPLKAAERTIGALIAMNRLGTGYIESDRQIITALAKSAANEIQTARLIQYFRVRDASQEANRWEYLASKNLISNLIDYLPASLYIIDPDYNLLIVNKVRRLQTGKAEEDLTGLPCYQALFGRTEPCLECKVRETLDSGQVTHRSERRPGLGDDIYDWEITSFPIAGEQPTSLQAVLLEMDNTEKRRLEAILTQSEKLAAVGQLAAGIAHEINNPLTAIIANAQILHREIPSDSELQESIELIARAGARAAQVVHNLLDFARKEEYRLRPTDLNKTVELALELVHHELVSRGAILEVDLNHNLPAILASADDLQSVWLNLLLNALDSLDKTPGTIRISSKLKNNELQISISDNGKGIPVENLSRIFEPFYTTKAPGRGTGLGLSVSHNIIKQHGGLFRIDSQVGEGSTFTVVFPVA